ncbi:unnamed protein product [Acanthoscelides obtectus]|uniref:Uncharacterized protein n=1 Tax=Acanthoscelides obtectus TaxID=200917 RepID=A0A9P0LSQ0_ACAOB|nr:unnamed protein product [Acanthoscelides obtectus]CAK1667083.1 General transcription factor II-I repeat domain-containing protein 2 [Acanthoscelides obtectus]
MVSNGSSPSHLDDATAALILPGEVKIFAPTNAVFTHPAMIALEAGRTWARQVIKKFLDTKDKILRENLTMRKTDIAYLTDLFTKFNMVNLQLQGDSLNLIKTKSILSAFLARVKLMKQNIGQGEFSQFPNLSQTSCQEDDVSTYVQHLNALYSDFESRFEDILTMVIPPWIINPYGDIEETNVIIQEELTELSTNEELKSENDKAD